ncbi:MAG: serine/threonine protein kinase [Clostridia bacterium]|nr:serine/threonine protein kinase [Clostridia bacterium]
MLEIGSVVDGKYKILSKVGQGGMSVVYMAINEKANKTWAVKEVRKDGVLDFESVKQGLVAETDILKKLNHPNLPSIIDVIDTEDSFIIIMDYIQGNSLNKALEEYGAQPQEYVIEWAKQLCDVFGYLHSREPAIIYRDMKPANVMLKPDGNVTLIDFGTAREFKERNLADTTCLGTVGYAAPEQFGGMGQTDARTDIYCLGATMYHLVTGCNPSEPPYEIKPIRQINPTLSSGLERIIEKCVQRNPEDRYQSAAELMYALEHYEEIDDQYRKKQKNKLSVFITMCVLCIVCVISGVVLNVMADKKATDSYQGYLDSADGQANITTKREALVKAINVIDQGGKPDAYLRLIQAYDFDNVFTDEEFNEIDTLISVNKTAMTSQYLEGYVDICYELGSLYWFSYDDSNEMTGPKNAIEWFKRALENGGEDYVNKGTCEAYISVGEFYKNIVGQIEKGKDLGMYKPLFENVSKLIDTVAQNAEESEIVRLEVLDLATSMIYTYSTSLKRDDIPETDVFAMIEKINSCIESIPERTEKITNLKNSILDTLPDAEKQAEIAYNTYKGGNK